VLKEAETDDAKSDEKQQNAHLETPVKSRAWRRLVV
jgi:hypothetical protein